MEIDSTCKNKRTVSDLSTCFLLRQWDMISGLLKLWPGLEIKVSIDENMPECLCQIGHAYPGRWEHEEIVNFNSKMNLKV